MEDLIKALQIFSKYTQTEFPTRCEHDILYICDVDKENVSEEDIKELDNLGFICNTLEGENIFISYRFGSC